VANISPPPAPPASGPSWLLYALVGLGGTVAGRALLRLGRRRDA
jgi:hypothetical protein